MENTPFKKCRPFLSAGCVRLELPDNVTRYCGAGGMAVRRRLSDLSSPTWEEEEEVVECRTCGDAQCDRPYAVLSEEWRHVRYSTAAQNAGHCDNHLPTGW